MLYYCPWWGGCFIDNPIRRPFHDPEKIVAPYVGPGMTAMDIGAPCTGWSFLPVQSLNTKGNSTVTRLPLPAALRMLHFPPISLARCRDPFQAEMVWGTAFGSKPGSPVHQSRFGPDRRCCTKLTCTFSLLLYWQAFAKASWEIR